MYPTTEPPAFVFRHAEISIAAEKVWLDGLLSHAPDARGLIVLLENGAGRLHDPLRRLLPNAFETARYACMSLDLVTRHEENRDPDARYNVPQMHHRLVAALEWARHQPQLQDLPTAIVASGTTTAAAIRAAAEQSDRVLCLICLAGRPDLAGAGPLSRVPCPTRFIVGANDPDREHHTQPAFKLLTCPSSWITVSGERGEFHSSRAIEAVTGPCLEWVADQLPASVPVPPEEDEA